MDKKSIIEIFQKHIPAPVLSVKRMESEAMNTVYRVDTQDGSFIFKRYTSGWPEEGKVPFVEAKLTEYGIPHAESQYPHLKWGHERLPLKGAWCLQRLKA